MSTFSSSKTRIRRKNRSSSKRSGNLCFRPRPPRKSDESDLKSARPTHNSARISPFALAKAERAAWQKLWQDVEALLKRAGTPK